MNKTVDPCNVCGGTDLNLVDGFYYCVECGTQDVNVRQAMVIEERTLADGTFTFRQSKKVVTVLSEKNEMPGEWHKWHAYNFILVGLADELVAAGAKPSFKMKVLWVWSKYIMKFQNKEELGLSNEENVINTQNIEDTGNKRIKQKEMKMTKDVAVIKKQLLFSILYVALNLDDSDIQVSDLIRFMREGRLDIKNCEKYVPKEINVKLIPGWTAFHRSFFVRSTESMIISISLLNCIGILPRMPNLRKMVKKFIKELCLPEDFKNLVFALMQLAPCDYLEINAEVMKGMVRFPAYECVVMSYILVAFKLCFGLDDDYEVRLSDAIDKINDENGHLKSYKIGGFSEETDRLFSFREWCNFIQLRKIILSKYYLHMSEVYLRDVDDYVYMEHIQNKTASKQSLSDEIIMKMLDNLPLVSEVEVIPRNEFKATTTPLSTYTDVIMQYFIDPDLGLLFSEDFTKYSLKYAVENLHLHDIDGVKNILLGINETKKIVTSEIYGVLQTTTLDLETVYVRNCDNKNWLKTNQPRVEHITKINDNQISNNDSDDDSNPVTVLSDTEANTMETSLEDQEDILKDQEEILEGQEKYPIDQAESEIKSELILEENDNSVIFDDKFEDIAEEKEMEEIDIKEEAEHVPIHDAPEPDMPCDFNQNSDNLCDQDSNNDCDLFFNPNTFDREKTIRELVLAACKKYKIRIPKEYDTKEPTKRKAKFLNDKAGESKAKRPRVANLNRSKTKPSVVRDEINDIITAYYKNVEHDVLIQISEHVKTIINKVNDTQESQNIAMVSTADDGVMQTDTSTHHDDGIGNDTHEDNIDVHSGTLDQSSVQCVCVENEEEELEKDESRCDPKFDEKEYDIKQLYVKVDADDDLDDPFDVAEDPVISEILDRKIEQIKKIGNIDDLPTPEPDQITEELEDKEDEDDDDNVPLSVLREDKLRSKAKEKLASIKLDNLVKDTSQVKHFKYWIREYSSARVMKTHYCNEIFHKELYENYPRSFYFVIRECATMIETTPYQLYKAMVNLELRLLAC